MRGRILPVPGALPPVYLSGPKYRHIVCGIVGSLAGDAALKWLKVMKLIGFEEDMSLIYARFFIAGNDYSRRIAGSRLYTETVLQDHRIQLRELRSDHGWLKRF